MVYRSRCYVEDFILRPSHKARTQFKSLVFDLYLFGNACNESVNLTMTLMQVFKSDILLSVYVIHNYR